MRKSNLDRLQIAAPCSADWNRMSGNDQVRLCHLCNKNVYNISDMTMVEAEQLIRDSQQSPCVRLYRRKDGTVLTDNCPMGLRQLRRHAVLAIRTVAACGAWLLSITQAPAQSLRMNSWEAAMERADKVLSSTAPYLGVKNFSWARVDELSKPFIGNIGTPPTSVPTSHFVSEFNGTVGGEVEALTGGVTTVLKSAEEVRQEFIDSSRDPQDVRIRLEKVTFLEAIPMRPYTSDTPAAVLDSH
jgi:hypothetical protein